MTHVVEIEQHRVVRIAYDTEDDEYTSYAEEITEAIQEGVFDPFDGTHELVHDVTNVCDRLEPNVWHQTHNKGHGQNKINLASLQTLNQKTVFASLPEEAIARINAAPEDKEAW